MPRLPGTQRSFAADGRRVAPLRRMILNPIDRIAKLIKTISGRRWRKKPKKEKGGKGSGFLSLVQIFEAFELETYFGLKTMILLHLGLGEENENT